MPWHEDDDSMRHGHGTDPFEPYREYDPTNDEDKPVETVDDETVTACRGCGNMIWQESEQCPECGEWLTMKDHAGGEFSGRSRVLKNVVVVVVMLLIVAIALGWRLIGVMLF